MRLKKWRSLVAALCALSLLGGCSLRGAIPAPAVPSSAPPSESAAEASPPDVEPWLENLTLEEKVGQLFFVRPDALDPAQTLAQPEDNTAPGVTHMTVALGNMLVRYPVGGVVIFGKNIVSPEQLRAFLQDLQRASKTPLLFSLDEEGGAVTRLAERPDFGLPRYPSAMAVGRQGPEAVRAMGRAIGAYLRDYGFHMDFAPVADVATNPDNPIIGTRAFSSEAPEAALCAGAMAAGLRQEGIIPVYKHFPGHGDTAEDSHAQVAVSGKTREELRECEWLPYENNDLSGSAVMVGHIALPAVTGEYTPASLSATVVDGCLRGELGFDGLVVTDALAMWGVKANYAGGEAAVRAIQAGCDVLLLPEDLPEAYRAVLAAVHSGAISERRLDESVRRILQYKAIAGLL